MARWRKPLALFCCPDDLNIRRFLVSSGQVDVEQVEQIATVSNFAE